MFRDMSVGKLRISKQLLGGLYLIGRWSLAYFHGMSRVASDQESYSYQSLGEVRQLS